MNRSSSLSNDLLRELKIFRTIKEAESEYYHPKRIQKNLNKFESARNSENLASTASSSKKEQTYNSNHLASSAEKSGRETLLQFPVQPDNSKNLSEKSNKSFHIENYGKLTSDFKKLQTSQFKSFEKLCIKYKDLQKKYADNLKIIESIKKQNKNERKKEKLEHFPSKSSRKKEPELSNSKSEKNKELISSELEKSKKTIVFLKNEMNHYRNEANKYQKQSELLAEEVISIRTEYSKVKNATEAKKRGLELHRLYETPIKIDSMHEKKIFDLVRNTLTKEDLRRELLLSGSNT